MGKVILTGKGRRWYLRGHPWIYKDDVATGEATPGELVPVEDPNGAPLGWGLFSTRSRIRVRMVTREAEQPNRAFWAARMQRAVQHRERLGLRRDRLGAQQGSLQRECLRARSRHWSWLRSQPHLWKRFNSHRRSRCLWRSLESGRGQH